MSLFFVAISVMGASLVLAGAPAASEPVREVRQQRHRRPRLERPRAIEARATPEALPQSLATPTAEQATVDSGSSVTSIDHSALGL